MSSQIGWPDGARAECGSARPSASPTTCDVAAVPRNWQPPPGEAQARQPSSAASSSVISPWAKRAPIVCTLPASSPSRRRQRHAAGHEHARQVVHRRPGPSSSPAGPCRRWPRPARPCASAASGSAGGSTCAASLRYGRLSIMPVVPCVRPSHGSVTEAGERHARRARCNSSAAACISRPTSQWPVW